MDSRACAATPKNRPDMKRYLSGKVVEKCKELSSNIKTKCLTLIVVSLPRSDSIQNELNVNNVPVPPNASWCLFVPRNLFYFCLVSLCLLWLWHCTSYNRGKLTIFTGFLSATKIQTERQARNVLSQLSILFFSKKEEHFHDFPVFMQMYLLSLISPS